MMIKSISRRSNQHGSILVMFTISILALVIVASLVFDGSHMLLNKGRLQNLVDSAALYAAKRAGDNATQDEVRQAVVEILRLNLAHSDQHELYDEININDSNIDTTSNTVSNQLKVEFSLFPDPFIADTSTAAQYVKVSLSQVVLDNFLADVINFNKQVSASAVAGPSTHLEECFDDLVPLVVCANDTSETADNYGFTQGEMHLMKMGSNNSSSIGPGNFQLIRLDGASGANDIKKALAGEVNGESCFSLGENNGSVPTEPGNKVGPVSDGLNTRMGEWPNGNTLNENDHPRDIDTCEGPHIELNATGDGLEADAESKRYSYSDYANNNSYCSVASANGNVDTTSPALSGRRILNVVIGSCTGETNGQNDLDYLGVACFFLTQTTQHTGTDSYVVGEFIENCAAEGAPSGDPVDEDGLFKYVLYHVMNSTDS